MKSFLLTNVLLLALGPQLLSGQVEDVRVARMPNIKKREMEKSLFRGVFNEDKYYPLEGAGRGGPESIPEEQEDLDILATELSGHHVDIETGEQYEIVLDVADLQNVIELGMKLGEELAKGEVVKEQDCEGADCEGDSDKDARRLFIFPPDERYEITSATWSPPRHAGLLTFSGGFCSATLIGPRHLLTAGHCVHEGDGGDWYSNFRFYPGRTSSNTPASFTASALWSLIGWTQNGDVAYDIGMVRLSQETGLGWVSFGYHSGLSTSWYMYSKGYPGDKSYGSQWSTSGYPSDVNGNDIRFKTLDAVGGQSGSPIYYYQSGNPVIYGTLCCERWWNFLWWSDKWNQFTRITSGRFSSMCDWINDYRLGC